VDRRTVGELLRRSVTLTEGDADFVQFDHQCAVEVAVRRGERVGQLLGAACTKDD
jgi:hypothetical protein